MTATVEGALELLCAKFEYARVPSGDDVLAEAHSIEEIYSAILNQTTVVEVCALDLPHRQHVWLAQIGKTKDFVDDFRPAFEVTLQHHFMFRYADEMYTFLGEVAKATLAD